MCVSALTRTVWSALYTCAHRRLHGAFSEFTFDLRVQVRIGIRLRSATWESFMSKSSRRHSCRFQSLNTSSVQLSSNVCVCVCVCVQHTAALFITSSQVCSLQSWKAPQWHDSRIHHTFEVEDRTHTRHYDCVSLKQVSSVSAHVQIEM